MNDTLKGTKSICILGMHRSGTSVISRAVNLLGAYLGREEDLMEPLPDNPKGFWELDDFVEFDERVLARLGMSWDAAIPPREGWQKSEEMAPFRDELAELVEKHFSGKPLWAWKDPRTTLLLDLWREVLDGQGVELRCLFAVRNPLDVARSLEKRDGIPLGKGYGVWFNYNLAALRAVRGLPCVFVSYDDFLADWKGELGRCASGLGLPWPEDDGELKGAMAEFIDPNLRHSCSGVKELEENGAPRPVVELYRAFAEDLEGGGVYGPGLGPVVDRLHDEFSSYVPFFRDDIAGLEEVKIKLAESERVVAEKEQYIAYQDQRIEELLNSWSWKVTSPLRTIVDEVHKHKKDEGKK